MTVSPSSFPVPLIHLSETNSTNSYLHALCCEQPVEEFTTAVTDFQTAGRGQRGNSWESESGCNLLFSTVLYPTFLEAKRQFLISQVVSLSIRDALAVYSPHISIKWPNDIYWKEKKISGILIENQWMGHTVGQSIAGVGININQAIFHSTAPNPVSLFQITQKQQDRWAILADILLRMRAYDALLRKGESERIATLYAQALFRSEGYHGYRDAQGEFRARIVSVEPEGVLVLEDEAGGRRSYLFKEVEHLLA